MKKVISLFQRNYDGDRLVRDEVVSGAEWVLTGEGVATEKFDGTACLVRDGQLYKRYDLKKGRTPPEGWEACEPKPSAHTGHWPGWLPVADKPEDKWHLSVNLSGLPDGTYELIGPKVQGNPHGRAEHLLVRHGELQLPTAPRDFVGLRAFFADNAIEGIVWHHPDGRMAKIKARDFGLKWPR